MDKRLEVFKLFAQQICSWFEDRLQAEVKYTADGNYVDITLKGYPLYPEGNLGNITIFIPANYIKISGSSGVMFGDIKEGHFKFYQGSSAYAHPHVWGNGDPCWNHVAKSNPVDLFCYIVHSLLLTNVTTDSLKKGRPCPNSNMLASTYEQTLALAHNQQKVVKTKLHLPNDVFELKTLNTTFSIRFTASINLILR